jgi:5-methylcytosine-specific restriction endonuclease McrA
LGLLFWGGLFLYVAIKSLLSLPERRRHEAQLRELRARRQREWELVVEPKNRTREGYPPDWEIRRIEVYFREGGRCHSCRMPTGFSLISEAQRWDHMDPQRPRRRRKWLGGAHVHHRRPVSAGGSHALDNLELLCESCHIGKHPHNRGFRIQAARNRVRSMLVGADAKVKTARKHWTCAACSRSIKKGERYFGGRYAKFCLACGRRHPRYLSHR